MITNVVQIKVVNGNVVVKLIDDYGATANLVMSKSAAIHLANVILSNANFIKTVEEQNYDEERFTS